jgi:endoglucanase
VDTVLLPNAFVDVPAIAQKNYDLSTLVGLLVDNNLVGTLQGEGPFTVFAPTNAAFEAISDVVSTLTPEQVVEVLTYHVLADNVESGDLAPTQTVTMLNQQDIDIAVDGGVVTITDASGGTAEVVLADQVGTNGVVHIIDAVLIPTLDGGNGGGDGELLTNGDFEDGRAPWTEGAGEIRTEGGNSFFFADVQTAGQPFDVNLSQVVEIVEGENYILEFDASTGSGNTRTMIAGIGLNEEPFTAETQTVNLTDQTQTFTYQLTANAGGANSRVLFDMGAETGVVVIDNVSLVQGGDGSDSAGNGGGDIAEPTAAAPTPPARDAADVISLFSDAYTNVENTNFLGFGDGNEVDDIEVTSGDFIKLYSFGNFVGIQLDSAIDLSGFTHMHFDYWVADESLPAGAVFNAKLSNHGNLPGATGETSALEATNPVTGETGQWVSFDVALDDFTAINGGNRDKIFELVFTTSGTINNVYIDNLYFYK